MRRHAIIAIPAYTGMVCLPTLSSLLADCLALQKAGCGLSLIDKVGATDIQEARAIMLSQFLANPDATDLVMIDHDVAWQPGGLPRLLSYEVDLVAGIYPRRADPIDYPVVFLEDRPEIVAEPNGLVEVERVPAGFLRISRRCAERMIEEYKHTEFLVRCEADGTEQTPGGVAYGVFEPVRIDGTNRRLSEDYSFCHRWRAIGGKVYIDPMLTMGHIGLKHFSGCLGRDLLAQIEATHEQA